MKEEHRLILIKPAHVSKFDIRLGPMVARRRNKIAEKRLEPPCNCSKRSKLWARVHGIKTNYPGVSFRSA
jgi:hypothetical protein